jgi:hypothetical protein
MCLKIHKLFCGNCNSNLFESKLKTSILSDYTETINIFECKQSPSFVIPRIIHFFWLHNTCKEFYDKGIKSTYSCFTCFSCWYLDGTEYCIYSILNKY